MFQNFSVSIICLFYIFSSTAHAASTVLGVDLGTQYIKATIVKPGIPLDIVLTKDSRRKEMSTIAFKPEKNIKKGQFPERVYGSDAMASASRFPGDFYPNLKTILGLKIDNSIVQEYKRRYPSLKMIPGTSKDTAAFQSQAFVPEELPWTVEEILAMELQNIKKNAQAMAGKRNTVKEVVITVPTYYTLEEKRAVAFAADLAGLQIIELISDGLAVGINYATSRTFPSINNGGKAETHLIFDMGAGSTKASILKFQGKTVKDVGKFNKTIQEIEVIGSGWDRTLGGDSLNDIIIDDMVTKFIASPAAKNMAFNAEMIMSNGKVVAKLRKEAEKLRHILSANANTQTFLEALYEDVDFKYKITRPEFEKLAEAHAARISATVQMSLNAAGLEIKNLDSVILHGGASRSPFVQKELEKFFGNAVKIKSNVNSDESAVFGAGFRGAALNPSFRVKEIRVWDSVTYAIGIKWNNSNDKIQHQRLWHPTSFLGTEKHYTFKNIHDPFILSFYQKIPSEINSSEFFDQEILIVKALNFTESITYLKEKYGCSESEISVRLSTHITAEVGEVNVTNLVASCEVDVYGEKESMVDSVKGLFGFGKKDQFPISDVEASSSTITTPITTETLSTSEHTPSVKADVKDATETSKRLQIIPLQYITELGGFPHFSSREVNHIKDRLAAFASSDNLRRLRDEALNHLEGFTYKVRDLLSDAEFVAVSTETEKTKLELKSQDISEWIYSGGTDASRELLKQKLKELKDIVTPIEFRKSEIVSRPEKISTLQSALDQTKQVILSITQQIAKDQERSSEMDTSDSVAQSTMVKPSSADENISPENKEPTTTESAQKEYQNLEPQLYTEADLAAVQKIYDEYSKWLSEMLAKQEKLGVTDDPVLVSKDLEDKIKSLQEAQIQILLKNMRKPVFSQSFNQNTKTKTGKATETPGVSDKSDSASKTSDIPSATFTVGAGDKMPSHEEMLEHLYRSTSQSENEKPVISEEKEEKKEKKAKEPKHVEL